MRCPSPRNVAALAALALTLAGCEALFPLDTPRAGADDGPPDAPAAAPPDAASDGPGGAGTACAQLDLLFMIDDSGSMIEEQNNLAIAAPAFMEVLRAYRTPTGQPVDFHLGVITPGRDLTYTLAALPGLPPLAMTEQGEDGALRGGCDLPRRWIEPTDPDPAALFACRAAVGTGGSGTEMPLYALKLATFDRVVDGTNAGFLRSAAPLVMAVITDEDDCSREDNGFTTSDVCTPAELTAPTRYRDYFDQLKGARDLWAMTIVAGPGPGECTSKFGTAADAVRLRALRAATGDNIAFESICGGNLARGLTRVLDVVEATCAR